MVFVSYISTLKKKKKVCYISELKILKEKQNSEKAIDVEAKDLWTWTFGFVVNGCLALKK